jgi:hypothetical protein
VVEAARVDAANLQSVLTQGPFDLWRDSAGFAAAGGWIDDQADGSGHGVIVLGLTPDKASKPVRADVQAAHPQALTASTPARA